MVVWDFFHQQYSSSKKKSRVEGLFHHIALFFDGCSSVDAALGVGFGPEATSVVVALVASLVASSSIP